MKIIIFAFSFLFVGSGAQAHILLKTPLPRPPNVDNLKQNPNRPDPCGSRTRGNAPIVYTPNQVVNFSFTETIEHPGRFKVQFSRLADQGFDTPENQLAVLEDTNNAQTEFEMTAKMPNMECNNCTLRVIQEMDEQPGEIYVNCIDIQLKGAISDNPADNNNNQNLGANNPAGDQNNADAQTKEDLPKMGGCGTVMPSDSGGPGGPLKLLMFLIVALPLLLLKGLRKKARQRP